MNDQISNEDEYFKKQDVERIRKAAEERNAKVAAEERARARELHFMKCPKCGLELHEITLGGVKVDKCFNCQGLWLDAGELEAIERKEPGFMGRLVSSFRF